MIMQMMRMKKVMKKVIIKGKMTSLMSWTAL